MPSANSTSPSRKRTITATKRPLTTSPSRSPKSSSTTSTRPESFGLLEEDDLKNLGISPPDQSQQHAGVLVLAPITPATTLGDAASIYLQYVDVNVALGRLAVGTARTRRYGLRHLSETLLKTPLGDLQRSEIIRWHDTVFMTPGAHGQTLRSVEFSARKALQALLGWCADRDAVMVGIAGRLAGEYVGTPGRALSREEFEALREELRRRDERQGLTSIRLLRVLADNGPRLCEVRLATVTNYRADKGIIEWAKGKNRRPRVIVLSDSSQEIIRAQIARYKRGLLFPSPRTGRALAHPCLNSHLKRVARAARLDNPDDISCHDLRHTFATIACEEGAATADIAEALSQDPRITENIYLHNAVRPAARRINALVNRVRRSA